MTSLQHKLFTRLNLAKRMSEVWRIEYNSLYICTHYYTIGENLDVKWSTKIRNHNPTLEKALRGKILTSIHVVDFLLRIKSLVLLLIFLIKTVAMRITNGIRYRVENIINEYKCGMGTARMP